MRVIVVRVLPPIKASRWNLCMTECHPSEIARRLCRCAIRRRLALTFPDARGTMSKNPPVDSTSRVPRYPIQGGVLFPRYRNPRDALSNLRELFHSARRLLRWRGIYYDNRTHFRHVCLRRPRSPSVKCVKACRTNKKKLEETQRASSSRLCQ